MSRVAPGRLSGGRGRSIDESEGEEERALTSDDIELGSRRTLLLLSEVVDLLDHGHRERPKSRGGILNGHGREDERDGFRDLDDVVVSEGGSDGCEEGVKLGEVGDEVLLDASERVSVPFDRETEENADTPACNPCKDSASTELKQQRRPSPGPRSPNSRTGA